ncbi:Serine/Threonine kinase domain protein (macronuclear) [Tetrahymena thermophila SB210]|uniref:Serine/Threonine kinase domain protein n=1 Tax=Tetrahymena thermophila (strain SB210) TaxID=312017 RepID=Q23Q13_TETTS|nr:Serine/Threonine kinase domain protein [Tetrahymena thermophila SB210]EAR98522.3 Serine/Threonine kinase domain protein [Tetrahymena thermophila SB210]|eukprot:XP_001018767.3 Serine/Threonine kinase domain protein [Tetrahymena thermophila SB210]
MIDCNNKQIELAILEDKKMKTSDIINPQEIRKGSSNTFSSNSSNFKTSNQQPQQQSQEDQNANGSNHLSQTLEFKRPRNKSFAKVLSKRQQIREKFKNDFFSGKKSPQKNPTEQQQNHVEISMFTENTDVEQSQSRQKAQENCAPVTDDAQKENAKEEKVQSFNEEDIIQPIFLRVASKQDSVDIDKDKQNNIFHLNRGGCRESFENYYELQDVLGEGCVGLVRKAIKITDQSEYAVKIVRTRDEETIMNIKNEFLHLRELQHKNIVKVYEIYIDKTKGKIYTIMELIKGREMFEVINQLGSYSEQIAKKIFRQIVQAISYMHSKYVCHRDLKPNNILCDETGDNVKITDFNVSKFCDSYKDYSNNNLPFQGIKMWTYTGTIAFSAPEIFKENCYDENIDIWSAGVILYTMLCGKEPFQAEFVKDLINKIIEGEYSFPSDPWDKISEEAKDLIKKCLTINPEDRIKPDMMLQHPWLQDDQKQKLELDRNQLVENIDRLVKGRTGSFEKSEARRVRSNTLNLVALTQFRSSNFMFSNQLFDNPTNTDHTEDSDDQEEDHRIQKDQHSPARAASYNINQKPNDGAWFDINQLKQKQKYVEFPKIEEDNFKKIKFLNQNASNNEFNIFPNRTSSYNIIEGNDPFFNQFQSPTKLKAQNNSKVSN